MFVLSLKVKLWITINEPYIQSMGGYEVGMLAPGTRGQGKVMYLVGHNLLKAHAEAYRVYDKEFRAVQQGI